MKKALLSLLTVLLFFCLGTAVFLYVNIRSSRPDLNGARVLTGIQAEITLLTDSWGVPHIYAQNEPDLFFACGYVQARDRLFQMDLMRRTAWGRLSEIFGEETLEKDKVMRTLGLGEAAAKDMGLLDPSVRELLLHFCRGVNAWMQSRRLNWPPEFLALRYQPEPWRPEDMLIIKSLMALGQCLDYPSEIVRMNLFKKLGEERALEILEEGLQGRPPMEFEASLLPWLDHFLFQGGGTWAISGNKTKSGRPLLANDSHLAIHFPSLWYEMHLNCPGLHVAGATIPGFPFILVGHNESLAWGMTNSAVDVQDLFIEEMDREGGRYKDAEGWKIVEKKRVLIKVRGRRQPIPWIVEWTDRGPLISPLIINSETPLSLRWVLHDGDRSFEAFIRMNKARNREEFRTALTLVGAPSQNYVFADRNGNIGNYLSGKIPVRTAQSGLFPYPGWLSDGGWKGDLSEEDKFTIYNPAGGVVVSANNRPAPGDYPHYLGLDFDGSVRAGRIRELLIQTETHTVESFQMIQNDVFSKRAEVLIPLLMEREGSDPDTEAALKMIRKWDLQMGEGSAPALYGAFSSFLYREIFLDELGTDFLSFDFLFQRKNAGHMRILMDPDSPWFDNTATPQPESRSDILLSALRKGYGWLSARYGADPEAWNWPEIHSLLLQHPLGARPLLGFLNRGPYPVKGGALTILSSYSYQDLTTSHSAGCRQIIDLSDWKKCVSVLPSGQSGNFLSPNYDDQISLWLDGKYHPMLFYSEDVETHSVGKLSLRPPAGKRVP
jgi:penicillin amidase